MASDEPTIIQPSGSSSEPAESAAPTVPTAADQPAPDVERTPVVEPSPPAELDKTADQSEIDRLRALARSTTEVDPTAVEKRPIALPCDGAPPSVPGYRALKKLGEGTFGQVWLFEAVHSGKRVAVKFFIHGATQQWQLLQAEIMQLARLFGDPGIVQLQDLEPDAVPPYCILTYAEGGSLADRLRSGPMPVAEALQVFREAARALSYVHAKGIIHCDLKPGNVLRDARGKALLADFGQAHLASDLSPSLGTFFYMAPEQADLAATLPDTRWDVYALGALFFAMVTGKPPRDNPALRDELGNTPALARRLKIYRDFVSAAPKPEEHRRLPGMDRRLAHIIDQCLETDPAKRLRDGGAILDALHRRLRALRQRPVFFFGLLAPLLLLVAAAITAISMGIGALRNADEALVNRQLKDNQALALLAANNVEAKLAYRLGLLERYARDDVFRVALARQEGGDNVLLQDTVADFRRRIVEEQPEQADPSWLFFQLFVADRHGTIIAESPGDLSAHNKNWAWRGWFNGEEDKHGSVGAEFAICRVPNVSQPYVYRGDLKNEADADLLVIALSVPVTDAKGKEVLGRLVGLMKIDGLYDQIDRIGLHQKNGCVVLVNEHHQLIYHGLHPEKVAEWLPRDRAPRELDGSLPIFDPLPPGQETGATDHFHDPVDDKDYLASFAPLKNRAWRVIVEHDRAATLEPSRKLADWMRAVGLAVLIAGTLVVLGMFWLLLKTMRRGEGGAYA